MIFVFREAEEISCSQIAEALNNPVGTLELRLNRARHEL